MGPLAHWAAHGLSAVPLSFAIDAELHLTSALSEGVLCGGTLGAHLTVGRFRALAGDVFFTAWHLSHAVRGV